METLRNCVFQAKDTEIRGTRFVITGLKTGGQYRFRVIAFNAAGNGEPGEVPEVLEVSDRTSEFVFKSVSLRTYRAFLEQDNSPSDFVPCSCS